jgi:hypothetical protein
VLPVKDTFGRGVVLSDALHPTRDRDLFCLFRISGDSEPVAALTTTSDYNQCCLDLSMFPGGSADRAVVHAATAAAYLARLRGIGVVKSADPHFTAAFSDYADSALPLQIWTLRSGRAVNSTQSFPNAVHHDAHHWWRQFLHPRNGPQHGLGALAAWTADRYVLGHGGVAFARLRRLDHAGRLLGLRGWPRGHAYVKNLKHFLIKTGYAG